MNSIFAVTRASGNEFFETVMQSMRMPIEFAINLARSLSLTRPVEHLRIVQTEHGVLFEAIEATDKEAARRAMRLHVENACSRIFEGPGSEARSKNSFPGTAALSVDDDQLSVCSSSLYEVHSDVTASRVDS